MNKKPFCAKTNTGTPRPDTATQHAVTKWLFADMLLRRSETSRKTPHATIRRLTVWIHGLQRAISSKLELDFLLDKPVCFTRELFNNSTGKTQKMPFETILLYKIRRKACGLSCSLVRRFPLIAVSVGGLSFEIRRFNFNLIS